MVDLPFGFDTPEDSPGFMLWQATTVWQRQIKKALEVYHISHAQFVIMATLMWFEAHQYDTTQILIAQWSKLDKMTVSKSLKTLGVLGLVHRIEHKTDTRAKKVVLTKKGKEMVCILVPIVERIDALFFGHATRKEQQSLIHILAKLVKSNDELNANGR